MISAERGHSIAPARLFSSYLRKIPWNALEPFHCLLEATLKPATGAEILFVEGERFCLLPESASSLSRGEASHAHGPFSCAWGGVLVVLMHLEGQS